MTLPPRLDVLDVPDGADDAMEWACEREWAMRRERLASPTLTEILGRAAEGMRGLGVAFGSSTVERQAARSVAGIPVVSSPAVPPGKIVVLNPDALDDDLGAAP